MADSDIKPYQTVAALFGAKPSWLSDEDNIARLQSYDTYERIYWSYPDTFLPMLRGDNELPVLVPTARTIVDTVNRYTSPSFTLNVVNRLDPSDVTDDVVAARMALEDMMKRENFAAKFAAAKRYCLIQGDWIWHITADETKEQGSRISINTLDPSMYFPVPDEDDIDSIVAIMLAFPVEVEGETFVRRVTYRKIEAGGVSVEEGRFAVDTWETVDAKPIEVIRPLTELPTEITTIPVYHIKNFTVPGVLFGSSELRGFESVLAGIVQTVSDEDLTLALIGIGAYETTAPQPIDPITKRSVPWRIGPGAFLHHPPESEINRLDGATTMAPFGEHYDRLFESVRRAAATADVAVGQVDATIASSGIALALQLSPTISKGEEKDLEILGKHDQMFYDLINMWYPAYEQTIFNEVAAQCTAGSAMPIDRESRFAELNGMLENRVISTRYYRSEAAKLGYIFPDDEELEADIAGDIEREDASSVRLASETGNSANPVEE